MVDPSEDTIMEERRALMVSPTGGDPTLRIAHFLKPSVTSIDGPVSDIPLDFLIFQTPISDSKKYPSKVAFNGWRNPQKDWKTWVDRMHSLHQSVWKKAGIHDAVINSTYKILENNNVILEFAEKWCFETKTFVLPWGEATITLEDMMVLGGYSVLGDSVLCPLENRELDLIHEKLILARLEFSRSKARKPAQSSWMAQFMDSGSEVEHEAFLALWLSRFVFPTFAFDTIAKNVFPIAIHLARGTKIALAPAVLASIYRDLSLLAEAIVASNKLGTSEFEDDVSGLTIWAPFQLVQVWVWERFPTMRPKPNSIENDKPRLARWDSLKTPNIENVRLEIESASEVFHWRPYTMAGNNSPPKFYKEKEEWVSVGSGLDEELESLARCFSVSELVGLDCIEQYLPHRVAMQFGMDQDLPDHVARVNTTREMAWENYTRPIGDKKLYFPSRLFESDVTTQYLCWNQSMFAGNHATKAVGKKESSSKNLKRRMPQISNGKKADNDALVPPGFPPKRSGVEASYFDEDNQTLGEFIRNKRSGDVEAQVQSPSSSTTHIGTVQEVQWPVKPVESFVTDDIRPQIWVESEARIRKLEKEVAQLKAAKLGCRFG